MVLTALNIIQDIIHKEVSYTLPDHMERAVLTLTNTLGVTVLTTMLEGDNGSKTIELDGLPSGVYFVNIADHTGKTCVGKVVKQ